MRSKRLSQCDSPTVTYRKQSRGRSSKTSDCNRRTPAPYTRSTHPSSPRTDKAEAAGSEQTLGRRQRERTTRKKESKKCQGLRFQRGGSVRLKGRSASTKPLDLSTLSHHNENERPQILRPGSFIIVVLARRRSRSR